MEIHIIGGGIGGLAVALGLSQQGMSPKVHESAMKLRSVGAGIALSPNALAALDHLNVTRDVYKHGAKLHQMRILDSGGQCVRTLDLTTNIEGTDYSYVYLHRAHLQNLLVDQLPRTTLHRGETCIGVEPGIAPEECSQINFADGRTVEASIAIGADGINSTVRKSVTDANPLRETETIAYRGITSTETALTDETVQVWGSGTRVGMAPLGDGRSYWFATANGHLEDPSKRAPLLAALQERYRTYPEPLPLLLARTAPEDIVVTQLAEITPLSRWRSGNVVLVGDAAHATLPYLGQGAAQALEDAVALSRRLTSEPPIAAIKAYVKRRKRRAEWVVRLSHLWWRIAQQTGLFARWRNRLVRYGPEPVARLQQSWLTTPAL